MSRESGFSVADIATNMVRDEKFRRLARKYPELVATAIAAYVGITLESWAAGKRLAAIDGWPEILPWSDAALEALKEFNLLDKSLRIVSTTWSSWYGAAFRRRERYRQAGSIGGQKKASNAASNATASLEQPSSNALPVPSVPSVLPIDSPKPPQVGAVEKKRRANGTSPRANGDSPRQREEAVKAGLLAAFNAIGGVKDMPKGLRDEGDPDAMDTDYIGGAR